MSPATSSARSAVDDFTFWWLTIGVGGGGGLLLYQAGLFRSPDQVLMRRVRHRLRAQRVADAVAAGGRGVSGIMRRLDELRDLHRLLLVAGEQSSPARWMRKVLGVTLVVLGTVVGVDAALYSASSGLVIPVSLGLAMAGSVIPLSLAALLGKAGRRRRVAGQSLGEALPVFAALGQRPLRDPSTVDAGDLLAAVAQSLRDKTLWSMLQEDAWKALTKVVPRTGSEFFEVFADAYGVPEARLYATALRNASEESAASLEEEYARADELYQAQQTASMRAKGRSRLVVSSLPGIGMLLALFIVILAHIFAYGSLGAGR